MTHDEKIVEAASRAYCKVIGLAYDDLSPVLAAKRGEAMRAAITAYQAEAATWIANCCNCGRIIDTRETTQGGDEFGCELTDGQWVCSPECWEAAVEPNTPNPPASP